MTQGSIRHPLGLPAGSVRALISITIMVMFWGYLLWPSNPTNPTDHIPHYLHFLMALVLVFFAAHGSSISPAGAHQPPPWHLPRGTFRTLITAGMLAAIGWLIVKDPEALQRLRPAASQLNEWPYLFVTLVGGFTFGWLLGRGPWRHSYWYQDIQAWLALIALIVLTVEILMNLISKTSLTDERHRVVWDCIVVGIIACYFGSRS
jgi:hypothetical protein